ncbi:MAG: PQQ-dependent dehydrogenase, methanol/ethanol family [Pseudomonadota bacterium]
MFTTRFSSLLVLATLLTACGGDGDTAPAVPAAATLNSSTSSVPSGLAAVTEARLENAESEPGQWMTYGGTYKEQRYSQLTQLTPANVNQLGLAWFGDFSTNRGQESTPLFIDGVIYVTESWSKVSAYDAKNGTLLWHYDPKVSGEFGSRGCCDVVNRGVAAWNGKIYVAAYDGRLIALDAATGTEVWSTVTTDQTKFYSITSAPRVANGKVFIGNAGAEYIYRGYVSAYDAETGEQIWRFYTVPGNPADGFESPAMEMAAATWSGNWWEKGGGGSTWDSMTYDAQTNSVLFGVGNGAPWNAAVRSPQGGDNLFTVSIVAVDADTGEYKWHFQEIPAEEWDYDAVQQIMLADLEVNGVMRHVAMQATKSGYYYMLDATTGELLVAENFVPVNWTTGYDLATGRPIINEAAKYTKNEGPRIAQPGPAGAHSWHPMSYSPITGLLYIPGRESSIAYTANPDASFGDFNLGVDFTDGDAAYDDPANTVPKGSITKLIAWDPVRGEEVWNSSRPRGAAAGTLATAGGLVFTGNPASQELLAFRADNGEQVWSYPIQAGVSAGAITFELDGEQYLAQVVGGNSPDGYYAPTYARLLVFKKGGTAQLPPNAEFTQAPFAPPAQTATEADVAQGGIIYGGACSICHGDGGASRGMFPDLRRSPLLQNQDAFDQVVLMGLRADRGMKSFEGQLTAADTALIRAYMIDRATNARDAEAANAPGL